ncbi:hypothetical protein M8J76_015888 [Diaphorina citri]|nr:hypothetical protein M8J76_015888 [Diaphorina citri]
MLTGAPMVRPISMPSISSASQRRTLTACQKFTPCSRPFDDDSTTGPASSRREYQNSKVQFADFAMAEFIGQTISERPTFNLPSKRKAKPAAPITTACPPPEAKRSKKSEENDDGTDDFIGRKKMAADTAEITEKMARRRTGLLPGGESPIPTVSDLESRPPTPEEDSDSDEVFSAAAAPSEEDLESADSAAESESLESEDSDEDDIPASRTSHLTKRQRENLDDDEFRLRRLARQFLQAQQRGDIAGIEAVKALLVEENKQFEELKKYLNVD